MNLTKTKIEKYMFTYRKSFIIVYLAMLLMRAIVPIASILPSKIDTIIFFGLMLLGAIYIAVDFFTRRTFIKMRGAVLLTAFLLITAISSLVNYKYGIFSNVKTIIWMIIQFYVLYSIALDKDAKDVIKEQRLISNILCIVWFFAVLASISMYFMQLGYEVMPNGLETPIRQGFYEMRLWGVFKDPNYASIISMVCISVSIANFKANKHIAFKIFTVINILVQYIYIVLSGSRTAIVACLLTAALIVFLVLKEFFKKKKNIKAFFCNALAVVIAGVVAVGLFASFNVSKSALEILPSLFSDKKDNPISLERPDIEGNEDISNLRFKIWASGMELFESAPITGTSPRNQLLYAEDVFPEGFIAKRQYMIHNGFLDVLVSTGILGAANILLFIVFLAYAMCKYVFNKKVQKNNYKYVLTSISVLSIITISTLFVCEIFFMNTIGTLLFWYFLGNAVFFMNKDFKESGVNMSPKFCENIHNKIVLLSK